MYREILQLAEAVKQRAESLQLQPNVQELDEVARLGCALHTAANQARQALLREQDSERITNQRIRLD